MTARGLIVVGTERGAGATTVACALASALHRRRLRVGVMKPVAVGCPLAPRDTPVAVGGIPGEQDAESIAALGRLAQLAGPPPAILVGTTPREALDPVEARRLLDAIALDPTPDLLEQACPHRFAADLEPAAAARAAGATIELETLRRAFARVAEAKDIVVVDGSAGLMCPLNEEHLMVDLALELGLLVVLVAPSRTWSVLSPCLLALSALASRGIPLAGVVLNRTDRELSPEEAVNPYQLELHAGAVVRGILPHLTSEQLADSEQLAQRVEVHLDVGGFLD